MNNLGNFSFANIYKVQQVNVNEITFKNFSKTTKNTTLIYWNIRRQISH